MKSKHLLFTALIALGASTRAKAAEFREYPIGDEVEKNQLKIAAVYFPAVPMDHKMKGHEGHGTIDSAAEIAKEKFAKPGKELIHLEADIHSLKDNPAGFAAGEWIPYLEISFKITDVKTKEVVVSGPLMPMIAKDGPHYGTTLRMPGKGQYKLEFSISAPSLARHTDPLSGVGEYWAPFTVSYDFKYEGLKR